MNRTHFYGGPGYITHDSVTWQSRENIDASNEIRTVPLPDNLRGPLGDREDYPIATVRLIPHAITASLSTQFGKLFAFQPSNRGALLFPGTDLPLAIQTKNGGTSDLGQSITYSAAAISQPPELQFAANRPLFGAVEFTCLKKNSTAGTATNAFVVVADSTYSEPTLDPTGILNTTYTVAWGSSFTGIETDEEGVRVATRYEWTEMKSANDGLLNFRLEAVTQEIRFRPTNVEADDIHDSILLTDGSSAGRGKLLTARGETLTVTGAATGDPLFTVQRAVPTTAPTIYGADLRSGEIVMRAQRRYNSGLQALFALTVVS